MTIAAFLDGVAQVFEQPPFTSPDMARHCRDYATIAAHLEEEDRLRREAAPAIAKRAGFAALAKERKKRAAKATK